jgi:hypothetical protein
MNARRRPDSAAGKTHKTYRTMSLESGETQTSVQPRER